VGAWIKGRAGHTSTSIIARRILWAALGLAPARTIFPNQRRNRSSPARLGDNIAAMVSEPHSWSIWANSASATSVGIPIG
jgi:hypothetical protein